MKLLKVILGIVCLAMLFIGIVYKLAVLPFSTPEFDIVAWIMIGVSAFILWLLGRGARTSTREYNDSKRGKQ